MIDGAVRLHEKLLLICSDNSIKSQWVEDEVETSFDKEGSARNNDPVLFPIRLDDAILNTEEAWATKIRRTRHIGDFTGWQNDDTYRPSFKRLLRDFRREESSEP